MFIGHPCVFFGEMSIGLLPIFWLACLFFWYWAVWATYIFWRLTLCQLLLLQLFFPILSCLFIDLFLFGFEAFLWVDQLLVVHSFQSNVSSICWEARVWTWAFEVGCHVCGWSGVAWIENCGPWVRELSPFCEITRSLLCCVESIPPPTPKLSFPHSPSFSERFLQQFEEVCLKIIQ